jgi:hypothetical protein
MLIFKVKAPAFCAPLHTTPISLEPFSRTMPRLCPRIHQRDEFHCLHIAPWSALPVQVAGSLNEISVYCVQKENVPTSSLKQSAKIVHLANGVTLMKSFADLVQIKGQDVFQEVNGLSCSLDGLET